MIEKEHLLQSRIEEWSSNAYHKGIVVFSDFLDLGELHIVNSYNLSGTGVQLQCRGGYNEAERQMVAFIPDALSYEWDFPISILHIVCQSAKFAEQLSHRDYLGAILNLGIDRGQIGDIRIDNQAAFVFCQKQMSAFLKQEVVRIKHTPVLVCEIKKLCDIPPQKIRQIQGTVPSLRLDTLIGLAFQTSRSSMIPYIEGGKVFVNGKKVISNGYTIKEAELISVRGKGKFRYKEIINKTKKGRLSVMLELFC